MKLKNKDKIETLKKLIIKRDGIAICRFLKEEMNVNPNHIEGFTKSPLSFFLSNISKIGEIDRLYKIRKSLSEEERRVLIKKMEEIPKSVRKAIINPVCREELEIKYGLYNSVDELKALIEQANKKLTFLTKVKRGIEKWLD